MGKVLASSYRYVEMPEEEGKPAKRHVYRPGESPEGLPKEVIRDLDERNLLVDERRFSKELGITLPPAEAIKRMEAESAEEAANAQDSATTTQGSANVAPKTTGAEAVTQTQQASKKGQQSETTGGGEDKK